MTIGHSRTDPAPSSRSCRWRRAGCARPVLATAPVTIASKSTPTTAALAARITPRPSRASDMAASGGDLIGECVIRKRQLRLSCANTER